MKLNDYYDWIVLGDHPGALLTASLSAKLGHSVLVLPFISSSGLGLSKSGQYVDMESNYLTGFGKSDRSHGVLREAFKKLGALSSELSHFLTDTSVSQVVTPEHRLIWSSNDEDLAAELAREFGKDFSKQIDMIGTLKHAEQELSEFWTKLPSRLTVSPEKNRKELGPTDIRKVAKKLAKGLKSGSERRKWLISDEPILTLAKKWKKPSLSDVLIGPLCLGTGGHPTSETSVSELFRSLVLARTAIGVKGGMTAYRDFLMRLAERAGAHVAQKGSCRRIFIERGKFAGVQIASRGNMVIGRAGVLGCSLNQAKEFLSVSGSSWFGKLKDSPQPLGWKFTVALTVHKEAIPPGMHYRTVWKETGAPSMEIEIADPADLNLREPDQKLIFARTILPFSSEGIGVEYQRVIASRMIRQLKELMPFLEYHIVRVYPTLREHESVVRLSTHESGDEGKPISADELSELYGFASPEVIPESLRVFGQEGVGSKSGVEGLFVASGESYPALGPIGSVVAAFESVAWLAHKSGLPGPLN